MTNCAPFGVNAKLRAPTAPLLLLKMTVPWLSVFWPANELAAAVRMVTEFAVTLLGASRHTTIVPSREA